MTARSESKCTSKCIRSKCNEDCVWRFYASGYLCRCYDKYPTYSVAFIAWKKYSTSDIYHLLISGVWVDVCVKKIATDNLCESDGCHCKPLVSH